MAQFMQMDKQQSFLALVKAQEHLAMKIAAKIAGAQEAPDIFQRASVRAYASIDRLRAQDSFGPWFLQIIYRESIRSLREKRRAATQLKDDVELEGGQEEALDILCREESRETLWLAVETLSEQQCNALLYYSSGGLTLAEIAERMGIARGTLKTHLERAFEILRGKLGPEFL